MKRGTLFLLKQAIFLFVIAVGLVFVWEVITQFMGKRAEGSAMVIEWVAALTNSFTRPASLVVGAVPALFARLIWEKVIVPVIWPSELEKETEPVIPAGAGFSPPKPEVVDIQIPMVPKADYDAVRTRLDEWKNYDWEMQAYLRQKDANEKREAARSMMLRITIGSIFILSILVGIAGIFAPSLPNPAIPAVKPAAVAAGKPASSLTKGKSKASSAPATPVVVVSGITLSGRAVFDQMKGLSWAYIIMGVLLGGAVCRVPVDTKLRHAWRSAAITALAVNLGALCVTLPNMRGEVWLAPVGVLRSEQDLVLHWVLLFRLMIAPLLCVLASAATFSFVEWTKGPTARS